ncbi:hypothetical protein, partial [Salinarimonas soli]|uniref:hypothetical protein n=1 Tax=Salinarimonas soli TaxID=1638099 RepID=UPI001F0ABAD6
MATWIMSDGQFQAGQYLQANSSGTLAAVLDLNGDHRAELIWADPGSSGLTTWQVSQAGAMSVSTSAHMTALSAPVVAV